MFDWSEKKKLSESEEWKLLPSLVFRAEEYGRVRWFTILFIN